MEVQNQNISIISIMRNDNIESYLILLSEFLISKIQYVQKQHTNL